MATPHSRLSRVEEKIHPFLRAPEDTGCELYWAGVPGFPMPAAHLAWFTDFFARLTGALDTQFQIRGEFFLQFKTIVEIEGRFRKMAPEMSPWHGLSRKPGGSMPARPSKEVLDGAMRGEPFDIRDYFPDSCFWLRAPLAKLMPEFFGLGGSSMFYLKADPETKPPAIPYLDEFKKMFPPSQLDKLGDMIKATVGLKDKFLPESKKLFGEGLEDEPNFRGITYILPLLETRDFFSQPAPEKQKWFQLFDVFWRESPPDQGVYIASKLPIEEPLSEILAAMKEEGKRYPER